MKKQCYHCEVENKCSRKKDFTRERCPFFQNKYNVESIRTILEDYQNHKENADQRLYDYIAYLAVVEEQNNDQVKQTLASFNVSSADADIILDESSKYFGTIAQKRKKEARVELISGILLLIVGLLLTVFIFFWFFVIVIVACVQIIHAIHKLKWAKNR